MAVPTAKLSIGAPPAISRRSSGEAGQIAGSRGEQPGFRAVRPTQPKVDERFPAGGQDRSRRFRGDERLKVEQIHDPGFDELRLGEGSGHAKDRLMWKKHCSFPHGMHVAGEPQGFQIVQARSTEPSGLCEPFQLSLADVQLFQEAQDLLQACGHQEATLGRQPPDEKLKDSRVHHALLDVGLHHGELIEVGQENGGAGVHSERLSRRVGIAPSRIMASSALRPSSQATLTARIASVSKQTW